MPKARSNIEVDNSEVNNNDISSEEIKTIKAKNLTFDIRDLRSEYYFKLLVKNNNKYGSVLINNIKGILAEDIIIISNKRGKINYYLTTEYQNYTKVIIFPLDIEESIGIGAKDSIKEGIVECDYKILYF
jgi:hypothetical protein